MLLVSLIFIISYNNIGSNHMDNNEKQNLVISLPIHFLLTSFIGAIYQCAKSGWKKGIHVWRCSIRFTNIPPFNILKVIRLTDIIL